MRCPDAIIARRSVLCLLLAGLGACGNAVDDAPVAESVNTCEALRTLELPGMTIAGAEVIAAGAFDGPPTGMPGFEPDYSVLPPFCRVSGSLTPTPESDIRFEVWLPETGWNGHFMQTGNGGAAGSIVHFSMIEPLSRGYAVANTDTGHQGGGGDFSWAAGAPEKLIDYQYRAVHELTAAGKAITAARYGREPTHSYWLGCSTGGRQGLKEAQRYPADYDAIIAGAPASNWTPLLSLSVIMESRVGAVLPVEKLAVLNAAALDACDTLDGVADRVISTPADCAFDPADARCPDDAATGCLTAGEVEAAQAIYRGVRAPDGEQLIPGTGPGSELEWYLFSTPGFRIGTSYYRNIVKQDETWDPATFDVETDFPEAFAFDRGETAAMDSDLSAFFARGGKLITYHGTTDGLIPYGNSVNYYRDVVDTVGVDAATRSMRFYLVPGMNHCFGGNGAHQVDWLSAMEDWVEQGRAPGVLDSVHPPASPDGDARFERPVCPYPAVATWDGAGNPDSAQSYSCR